MNRPGARFLLASGQVGLQAEGVKANARELIQARLALTGLSQHFARIVLIELNKLGLKLCIQEDRFSGSNQSAQFVLHLLVVHLRRVHVEHEDEGLGCHQLERLQCILVELCPRGAAEQLAAFEQFQGLARGF